MCRDCDYGYEKETDYRRGKVDVDDFYKEVNYQTRLKGRGFKRKAKAPKTRPGCPGNDFNEHVYVWTVENEKRNIFSDYYGFSKYESKICCGCGKRIKTRLSEQYEKIKARRWAKRYGGEFSVTRGEPVSRGRGPSYSYWSWENYDAAYAEARKKYIARNGWTSYLYNF